MYQLHALALVYICSSKTVITWCTLVVLQHRDITCVSETSADVSGSAPKFEKRRMSVRGPRALEAAVPEGGVPCLAAKPAGPVGAAYNGNSLHLCIYIYMYAAWEQPPYICMPADSIPWDVCTGQLASTYVLQYICVRSASGGSLIYMYVYIYGSMFMDLYVYGSTIHGSGEEIQRRR
eukprot:jgi/Botrbrau1/11783/Bobra.0195s0107.1